MSIENIIRRIKNKPDYKWESSYGALDLGLIASTRAMQLLRGMYYRLFFNHCEGLLFIGKAVTLRHSHLISAGKHLILDDSVYVNALSENGIVLGKNVSVGRGSILVCTGVIAHKGTGIIIGDGTGITVGVYLGGQGGITIGKNVIIGPYTKILSENHNYSDPQILIKDQGVTRKGIKIEDNCWIGAGVTILDGVTVGEGCVIAAGSIVTESIPPNSVAVGVPAKVIKNRTLSKDVLPA